MIEKKIAFEFIQVGNFEPPAGNAPEWRANGMFNARGRREDDVPQIGLLVVQCDAKHAAGAVVIRYASASLLAPTRRILMVWPTRRSRYTSQRRPESRQSSYLPQEFFPRFGRKHESTDSERTLSPRRRFFRKTDQVCGPALQAELPDPLLKSFAKRQRQRKKPNRGELYSPSARAS